MSKEFSIVIVTHNGLHDLRKCVDSLCSQLAPNWEIVLVDNASSDGTAEFFSGISSDSVRYVPLNANTGFAAANNTGVAHARGEWLLLLNNDATCVDGTLRAFEEGTRAFPQFQIFACQMIRSLDGRVDNLGIRFTRSLRGVQIESGAMRAWPDTREVFGASGGAMLVHRSVIDDIGLFDPAFFAYQEDVDFAVRARLAGYRCLYLPDAIVHHKGGGTSSSNPSFFRYFNQRNMELVLRNLPMRVWWKYGPLHFAYAISQVLKWTLKGDGLNVVKAKIDAIGADGKSSASRWPVRVRSKEFERFLGDDFSAQIDISTKRQKVLASD
jgi:GT2 family glycosyltransferase